MALIAAAFTFTTAQDGLTRGELLNTMNDLKDIEVPEGKLEPLKEVNKEVVDGLFDIAEGGLDPSTMTQKFKDFKESSVKKFEDVLGKDAFKKYKKQMKKKLKPLKRKANMVKWLL